jgi:hypothetical protein
MDRDWSSDVCSSDLQVCPGAVDNASGLAVITEAARLLAAGKPLERDEIAREIAPAANGSPRFETVLSIDGVHCAACVIAIEDALHSTARLGIPGDLPIPRINLAEFEVGKPSQKLLPLAQGKRLHLLGDLLHAGRHAAIIARTAGWRQSKASSGK